jgi:hypothetical protein
MNKHTWTESFPSAKIKDTKKKFYNRYAFCLEYSCPGGRIIHDVKSTLDVDVLASIGQRIERDTYTAIWKAHQWYRAQLVTEQDINFTQISHFAKLKFADNPGIHIRIEEPYVRIYCDDEGELYRLANEQFIGFRHTLLSVFRPSNPARLAQLAAGTIIMKQNLGYRYKFIIRDGRYGKENKAALVEYLDQLGDLVKISPTVRHSFSVGDYMFRCWFYSNEMELSTMINLITPGAISKIHSIVYDN